MNGQAGAPPPSIGGSIAAIAVGLVTAGLGFLAAAASAMASAPTRWTGLAPLAIMAAGAALTVLGLVSIPVPRLRAAAKWCAIAALVGFAGLYVLSQFLMATGIYDG